jgi:hypothetical protein
MNDGIDLVYIKPSNMPNNTNDRTADFYCKGSCGGPIIELTAYEYNPTPKFLESVVVPGQTVKIGRVQIDSVDNLLLGETETSAQGRFTWHTDLNAVGQAITGVSEFRGPIGQAEFRKQPDGAWVCVSH